MKLVVVDHIEELVSLGELSPGDVFAFKTRLYMRIDTIQFGGAAAVSLTQGTREDIRLVEKVRPVRAQLRVEAGW